MSGGEHMFVSDKVLRKDISAAFDDEKAVANKKVPCHVLPPMSRGRTLQENARVTSKGDVRGPQQVPTNGRLLLRPSPPHVQTAWLQKRQAEI